MTSFLQLNIDLKAPLKLNCSCLHWEGSVCVGTCCVLTLCYFFFGGGVDPLTFTAADSSNLSSCGYRTFSHRASSVIKHDNRLMMIPAAQSHDPTLSLFMISFCSLSFLSPFFFPLLFWVLSSEHNSTFPLLSASWRMTSALSQSIREAVGGGDGASLNFARKCVCGSPGWIIHNICWAGGDSYDLLQFVRCVYKMSALNKKSPWNIYTVTPGREVIQLLTMSETFSGVTQIDG